MNAHQDARQRFTHRVRDYADGRPGYPARVVTVLREQCGLRPGAVVADVGCGTGLLARVFVEAGDVVIGIEPNAEMRSAAAAVFAGEPRFRIVAASAEETGLEDASVDAVVAGQAAHWFDASAAAREFARILRPGGCIALIWNDRHLEATPFLVEYEALIHDYADARPFLHIDPERVRTLFGAIEPVCTEIDNVQSLDLAALRARVFSSSYMPMRDDPVAREIDRRIEALFERHQQDGRVQMLYRTRIWHGRGEAAR